MSTIITFLLKCIIYPISYLPLGILYFIGNLIAWILEHIIRYRKKVVLDNLTIAFPKKTNKERIEIAHNFYHYFAQLLVETIKSFTISQQEVERRCVVTNPEDMDRYFKENRNVIMLFAHYNNWEWAALGCNSQIMHRGAAIYKPVKNESLNNWIKTNRSRMGTWLMSMKETKPAYENPPKELFANGFIADQRPFRPEKGIWVNFFGRKTSFLAGPAKYAKTYDLPLVYVEIKQEKKGFYTFHIETVIDNPSKYTLEEITQKYASRLEQQLHQNPNHWLWSHKRWKHKYEDYQSKS